MELFGAVHSHVEFHTVSISDSVNIVLPVISAFVTSTRHALSQAFVTSAINQLLFLGSNKITCT